MYNQTCCHKPPLWFTLFAMVPLAEARAGAEPRQCCLLTVSSHATTMARTSRLPSRYTQGVVGDDVPATSPATGPAMLLHVVALALHLNAFRLLWQPTEVKKYMDSQWGGQWTFLTVLR